MSEELVIVLFVGELCCVCYFYIAVRFFNPRYVSLLSFFNLR
jgi:hypothetical protein